MNDQPYKVLIIEDEKTVTKIVSETLLRSQDFKYEVESAESLDSGLKRLGQGGIQVIILDLGLPDSAGYETFRKVKEAVPHIPIVLLTGLGDNEIAMKAVSEGAQEYLVKGQMDIKALPRTLAFAIQRHHQR